MKRKEFLGLTLPVGLGIVASPGIVRGIPASADAAAAAKAKIPQYLVPGDTIGITSPAGFITLEGIMPAVKQMEAWGFTVKIGSTIGKRDGGFGGTDAERLEDMQQMLDDENVHAVMCARGGYGAVSIIDQLDFKKFTHRPKWLIGFSDITVIHCHVHRQFRIATIHSKMCNSFPSDPSTADAMQTDTIESIRKALTGAPMEYVAPHNSQNRPGTCTGQLIGGNLRTIENMAGSASQIKTKGKILFVEDTGEYLYSIDRMFWNLKRAGMLDHLAGLIVGGFKVTPDTPGEEFGRTLPDIVLSKVKDQTYPVCFDFPVGHQRNNYALKCGVEHKLTVSGTQTYLTAL
ncbi:MAG: LD-carboxypeptidase [Sphingobacteriales bacterium]|nr:MAG: LD-carboxypeptidase [Sphingobacteriales bacterium]